MAWAHVQDGTSGLTASSGTTVAPTFTSNATVGNQVIIAIVSDGVTLNVSSISGFGVTTDWKLLHCVRNTGAVVPMTQWIFAATVVTGSLKTATITFSGTIVDVAVNMLEFSGGTLNVDAFYASTPATSTTPVVGDCTPQSANTLLIAGLSMAGTSAVSTGPASPWTNLTQATIGATTAARNIVCSWSIQTTRVVAAPTYTMGTSRVGQFFIIGLQAATTTTAACRVQGASDFSAAAATSLAAHPITPGRGNTLIAIVGDRGLGATAVTVSDGVNTWNRAASIANGTSAAVEIWYAFNVAAVATTVTAAFASATAAIYVSEWVGLMSLDAAGAGTTGTSTAPSSGNVVTVAAKAVVIAGAAAATQSAETAILNNNFGSATGEAGLVQAGIWGACLNVAAQGTYTVTFTTTSAAWAGVGASFRQSDGSPPNEFRTARDDLMWKKYRQGVSSRPPFKLGKTNLGGVKPTKYFPRPPIGAATGWIVSRLTLQRPYMLSRLIQPPASALAPWMHVVERTRRWKARAAIKPLREFLFKKLVELAQPPASTLGMRMRIVKKPKRWVQRFPQAFRRTAPVRRLRFAQPPASALGLRMLVVKNPRRWKPKIIRGPLRRSAMELLRVVQPPAANLGFWIRTVKKSRSWKQQPVRALLRAHLNRLVINLSVPSVAQALSTGWVVSRLTLPRPSMLTRLSSVVTPSAILFRKHKLRQPVFRFVMRAHRFNRDVIQPPASALGLWMRVVRDQRRWKSKPLRGPLHRSSMRLLRLIQPPAAALAPWLRLIKRPRRFIQRFPKAFRRAAPMLRLRGLIQPPAASLGVWMRVLRRQRQWRARIQKPTLRASFRKFYLGAPASIATAQFLIKIVHRTRLTRRAAILKPLRRYALRLLRIVQPPPDKLAPWMRLVQIDKRKWRPRAAVSPLRVFLFRKLTELAQPPASALGMWMHVLKHPRRWRARVQKPTPRASFRKFYLGATGVVANLQFLIRTVHRTRRWKPQKPFSYKLGRVRQIIRKAFTTPPVPTPSLIYIGSFNSVGQIAAFPIADNGNVGAPNFLTPTAEFFGPNTGFAAPTPKVSDPAYTAIDTNGNLWVATILADASTGPYQYFISKFTVGASGNIAPTVTIGGSNTGLSASGNLQLGGIAFDANGNLWVVADYTHIAMFSAAQLVAGGNIVPANVITGPNTGLTIAFQIAVDRGGQIYVTDANPGITIRIFAINATGNAAPVATISGNNTGLINPFGIALDSRANIYVVDRDANQIAIWNAGVTGNVAPSATISGGNTHIGSPISIALDSSDKIYLAHLFDGSSPAISVWPKGTTGNVAPSTSLIDRDGNYISLSLGYMSIWNAVAPSSLITALEFVHRPRRWRARAPMKPLRRYSMRLMRTVQPPAVKLAPWIRIVKDPRRWRARIQRAPLRASFRDLYRAAPAFAQLAIRTGWVISRLTLQRPDMLTRLANVILPGPPLMDLLRRQKPWRQRFPRAFKRKAPLLRLIRSFPAVPPPVNFATLNLLFGFVSGVQAAALGIRLSVLKRQRRWVQKRPRAFKRKPVIMRLRAQPPKPSPYVDIVHRTRRVARAAIRRPLRRYPLDFLRLIQPPTERLGVLIKNQRRWAQRFPKAFKRTAPVVRLRFAQPDLAQLGVRFVKIRKKVTARQIQIALQRRRRRALASFQPAAIRFVRRARRIATKRALITRRQRRILVSPAQPVTAFKLIRRLRAAAIRRQRALPQARKLIRYIQPDPLRLGVWLRTIKDTRRWRARLQQPTRRVSFDKLYQAAPAVLTVTGLLFKLVHRTRLTKRAVVSSQLRRSSMRLLRLVQPPIFKLSVWLRQVQIRKRPWRARPPSANLRFSIYKVVQLIVPTPTALGVLPKLLRRRVRRAVVRPITILQRQRRDYAAIQPAAVRFVRRARIITRKARQVALRRRRAFVSPAAIVVPLKLLRKALKPSRVTLVTRRFRSRLLRIVQPPVANLAPLLRIVRVRKMWRALPARPNLRVFQLKRLGEIFQPPAVNLGIWLHTVKDSRRWSPKRLRGPLRAGYRRMFSIPPPNLRDLIPIRLVHRPHLVKGVAVRKPLRRYVMRLFRLIEPIQLGLPPYEIFRTKTLLQDALYRTRVSSRLPFRALRRFSMRLLRLIQPPAFEAGLLPSQIFRAKTSLQGALYRAKVSSRAPFRNLRRYSMRLLRTAQPLSVMLGIWMRFIKDPRRWRPKTLRGPLRRYPLELLRLVQPPAANLGIWLEVIRRQKRWAQRFPKVFKRTTPVIRLLRSMSRLPAGLGIWMRVVRKQRRWTQRFPKAFRRPSPLSRFSRITQPPTIVLGMWLEVLKRQRRWAQRMPRVFRRPAPIFRLRSILQPPVAQLGAWMRTVRGSRRKWAQRLPKAFKRIAPVLRLRVPAGRLPTISIWMRTIKRPRRWVQRFPKAFRRTAPIIRVRSLIIPPASNLGVLLRKRRFARRIRQLRPAVIRQRRFIRSPFPPQVQLARIIRRRVRKAAVQIRQQRLHVRRLRVAVPPGVSVRLIREVIVRRRILRVAIRKRMRLRLLSLIQPPARGIPSVMIRRANVPRPSIRFAVILRVKLRLSRLAQPPTDRLGVWLRQVQVRKRWRARIQPPMLIAKRRLVTLGTIVITPPQMIIRFIRKKRPIIRPTAPPIVIRLSIFWRRLRALFGRPTTPVGPTLILQLASRPFTEMTMSSEPFTIIIELDSKQSTEG